ncbi:MAG: PQQ-dependent sugar dehydrogenase [Spirochaetaceae bacterium]
MKVVNIVIFLIFSSTLFSQGINGKKFVSEKEDFTISILVDNLEHPWSLSVLPEEQGILITERPGKLYIYKDNHLQEIIGLPQIAAIGQGGMLDIISDPDFLLNKTVYFSYVEAQGDTYGTVVAKSVLEDGKLKNMKVIFRAEPKSTGGYHFGSRLVFGADGYLYITLGERGQMENAQNLAHHGGSVIRIDVHGYPPEDNPFFGSDNYLPEIYSYGHRNSQGIVLNQLTGDIWLHEHGPKGGDEINIIKPGANYGWPLITYGIDYNGTIISNKTSLPGMEQPVIYWIPSIAPSGMTFYNGNLFPKWKGNLFVGALAGKHLRRLEVEGNTVIHQEVLLKNIIGRIRDVRSGPDGVIYILTDENQGALYKLSP